ncbi:hypothetical protein [uncultured Lutibacter sp.]|uniref:hypothetical protein n=1 Tax=uncultured Lutibacter sp. TaxID=437739 RepID=UPI0026378F98|nr:hypothetical protein [uncultured Lutibacter sp.]
MAVKFSKFISIFFHPINFPIIGAFIYFLFIPKHIFKPQEYTILMVIFIGTYVFPLVFLYLLKRFGMINSYYMANIEERKFPTLLFLFISIIIGNWLYRTEIVHLLSILYFGYGLGFLVSYIFLYLNLKISLHTAAIGGLIGFLIYFSISYKLNIIGIISAFFVLAGIIASARLRLKAHTLSEVFIGFLAGIFTQFITYAIYYIM